jgi:hypothetical protein
MLYDNPLTPDPNDCTGKVQLTGTVYNANIARTLVDRGSEVKYDTIMSILNSADGIKRESLSTGHSVIDGVAQMRPSITGRFDGQASRFNPEIHSLVVVMTPTNETNRLMAGSKAVVIGTASTGPMIGKVEDVYTKNVNGVITPGRNLRISGQRLRIAGSDASVGVWFIVASTSERIRLDDRDLVNNDPSELTIVVPQLAPDGYFLEVVTQSSGNSKNQLLKEPRTYRFETMLTVE